MKTTLLGLLKASAPPSIIHHIVTLINTAYLDAEGDLFGPNYIRTSFEEIQGIIKQGEMYAISTDPDLLDDPKPLPFISQSTILGVFRIRRIDPSTASLGFLVVTAEHRRAKLGRILLDHFGLVAKQQGYTTGQVELLLPSDGKPHTYKDINRNWYEKNGYEFVRREDAEEVLKGHGVVLARPVEFIVNQKVLA